MTAVHAWNIYCSSVPSSSLVYQNENSKDCKLSLPLKPKVWDHSYLGADLPRYILQVSCTSLACDLGHTDVAGTSINDFPILPDFQKVLHINLSSIKVSVFGSHLDKWLTASVLFYYCLGGKLPLKNYKHSESKTLQAWIAKSLCGAGLETLSIINFLWVSLFWMLQITQGFSAAVLWTLHRDLQREKKKTIISIHHKLYIINLALIIHYPLFVGHCTSDLRAH